MNDQAPPEPKQFPVDPDLFRKSVKRMKKEITEGFPANMVAIEAMQILRTYFGPAWILELTKIDDAGKKEYEAAKAAECEHLEVNDGLCAECGRDMMV